MKTRRNFIKNSSIALGVGLINLKKKESMNFIHHVLFWAKNPENEAEKAQLKKALIELGQLPMIQNAHVGNPIVTEFDKNATEGTYTFSVVLVFESAAKEDEYLHCDAHMKFIKDNKHLWGKVMVIDSIAV